jgi:poly [ADP-ribose] polymerase
MTYNITEPETLPNYMVDPAVEPLIHRIFDMNLCKDVQIDLTKCPLGMLSLTQINKAYTILTEMLNPSVQVNYEELTEHYYNTIPTRKGHMGLINTREKIQEKLDFLTELENIHHISKHDKLSIQTKYLSLQADVRPVDTETRSLIEQYLGTNSGYHNMKLKFVEAFEINKPAEAHSFRRWETLHNKHLLWHGTAMSNVAGILTNGLCLNPSIPVAITGKMFGSGLYFANVSTKSAGYLRITSGIGAMFLCEVALGNMLELKNAQQVTLPSGKHSVRGMGHFTPDTETFLNRWDDVTVPIGKLIISDDPGVTLQYDEFIVYDQTQVRLRYLVLIDLKN